MNLWKNETFLEYMIPKSNEHYSKLEKIYFQDFALLKKLHLELYPQ